MLDIRTASGTQMLIKDIENGEDRFPFYMAKLARISDAPLTHVRTGDDMNDSAEFFGVYYTVPPAVGSRFSYVHETRSGCLSTEVLSITEVEDA